MIRVDFEAIKERKRAIKQITFIGLGFSLLLSLFNDRRDQISRLTLIEGKLAVLSLGEQRQLPIQIMSLRRSVSSDGKKGDRIGQHATRDERRRRKSWEFFALSPAAFDVSFSRFPVFNISFSLSSCCQELFCLLLRCREMKTTIEGNQNIRTLVLTTRLHDGGLHRSQIAFHNKKKGRIVHKSKSKTESNNFTFIQSKTQKKSSTSIDWTLTKNLFNDLWSAKKDAEQRIAISIFLCLLRLQTDCRRDADELFASVFLPSLFARTERPITTLGKWNFSFFWISSSCDLAGGWCCCRCCLTCAPNNYELQASFYSNSQSTSQFSKPLMHTTLLNQTLDSLFFANEKRLSRSCKTVKQTLHN